MNNQRSCGKPSRHLVKSAFCAALFWLVATSCFAAVPDWLRSAARQALPPYPPTTDAVVLLDEQETTVSGDGQIKTVARCAIRILRDQGKTKYGKMEVSFDSETQITYLKGWSLAADGKEYEMKDKDTTETNWSSEVIYQDTRYKIMKFPGAAAGTVVGYEYQQNRRPAILQDVWGPQQAVPVIHARYSLQLPPSWQYRQAWMNAAPREPSSPGQNLFVWEMADVPPITPEPKAPPVRALAVRAGFTFVPPSKTSGRAFTSWMDVAGWFAEISAPSQQSSPEVDAVVQQLTAKSPSLDAKIRALGAYVQKQVRYVAIEIGIGGYQPHPAAATLANKYGDCKDKATLLAVMLRQAGIRAYLVAIYSSRGVVRPDFPSPYQFNHMIVAIQLPPESELSQSSATMDVAPFGRMLFFDPTAEVWPVGTLIDDLQDNTGLLMAGESTRLVTLPVASPADSRLTRTGEFILSPDGSVTGKITEEYTGSWAARMRDELADMNRTQKGKLIDLLLSEMQGSPAITHAEIQDEYQLSNPLILRYEIRAVDYAKLTGDLMLVRPRVTGSVADRTFEWKDTDGSTRQLPLEYAHTGIYSEVNTVQLPAGFLVDELPDPMTLDQHAVAYKSAISIQGDTLRLRRDYSVATLTVPAADVSALRTFYRQVHADEQKSVVLKRTN